MMMVLVVKIVKVKKIVITINKKKPSYSTWTGHCDCHDYHCIPGDACNRPSRVGLFNSTNICP